MFKSKMQSFIRKYSRLGLYLPVYFEYLLKKGDKYKTSTSFYELTEGRIKGSKDLTIFSSSDTIEELLNIEIGLNIGNDTKRHIVWTKT